MAQIKTFFDGVVRELHEERKDLQKFLHDNLEETRTDVKHLWARLEQQWDELQEHHAQLQSKAGEAAGELKEGMEQLIEELRDGYQQVGKTLRGKGAVKKSTKKRSAKSAKPGVRKPSSRRNAQHPPH